MLHRVPSKGFLARGLLERACVFRLGGLCQQESERQHADLLVCEELMYA